MDCVLLTGLKDRRSQPERSWMMARQEQTTEVGTPIELLLWISRRYLLYGKTELLLPSSLEEEIDEFPVLRMLPSLMRILDVLVAATNVSPLIVHAPGCRRFSLYEQAMVTALHSLQAGSDAGFRIAMSAVLPPTALRAIQDDMVEVAAELYELEHRWPQNDLQVSSAARTVSRVASSLLH